MESKLLVNYDNNISEIEYKDDKKYIDIFETIGNVDLSLENKELSILINKNNESIKNFPIDNFSGVFFVIEKNTFSPKILISKKKLVLRILAYDVLNKNNIFIYQKFINKFTNKIEYKEIIIENNSLGKNKLSFVNYDFEIIDFNELEFNIEIIVAIGSKNNLENSKFNIKKVLLISKNNENILNTQISKLKNKNNETKLINNETVKYKIEQNNLLEIEDINNNFIDRNAFEKINMVLENNRTEKVSLSLKKKIKIYF